MFNYESFTPKGYVIIKDAKTGKILREGNNMIVSYGRLFVYSCFVNTIKSKIYNGADFANYATDLSTYNFTTCRLGDSMAPTVYEDSSLKGRVLKTINIISSGDAATNDTAKITINTENDGTTYYSLKLMIENIKGGGVEGSNIVSELGLFISDSNNPNEKMFSRIAFDPVPFTEDTELRLEYYIYF